MSSAFLLRKKFGLGRLGLKALRRAMGRKSRFARMKGRSAFRHRRNLPNLRVGGFLGIEVKFYDQKLIAAVLNAPTDATAGEHNPSATICLNSVPQGDGESNRDGRKITMRSIFVEGNVTVASQTAQSGTDAAAIIFIALVQDTQTNGALLNSEDVFTNPGANGITAGGPFRNLQFAKRFRVLATRKFTMAPQALANDTGSTGGIVQGGLVKRFRFFKKMNQQVIFKGTTETIANITDNSLHIIAYTNSTAQAPLLSYNCRLRFVG